MRPRPRLIGALFEAGRDTGEVNVGGDFSLPQLVHGSGLIDQRLRTFLDRARTALRHTPRRLPSDVS